ncbi:rhamnogalacturonidase [Amycolatopsis anabasis]|uniref:rhamnogalacturonidase n=1 Tax=Amycolatopsis anabasis TaxID=1840409 RepID=UPI00131C668E|nr:glycosyl hydrolase family 28-related protein [Amycolatopsis anabasis]
MAGSLNRRKALLAGVVAAVPITAAGSAASAAVPGQRYDVRHYGARGNGTSIDSPAINRAIEAAAAGGGGTVYFPAGTYASYTVRLKSNVALYFDHGATLLGATPTPAGGYDPPGAGAGNTYQDFGHSHWRASLIWGENLENISLLGPGRIDGNGLIPRMEHNSPRGAGDKAIALKLCREVTIRDVTIVGRGHIAILATGVDNLTINDVTIDTLRDGINVDCCRNVRVSDVTANTFNDDGIALKSSYALGFARATENVTIANCLVSGYDVGSLAAGTFTRDNPASWDGDGPFGRVKFGTESVGGFKNITISNVLFDRCRGIALDTVDGGVLEDVTINAITMRDIVNSPIFLRLGARMSGPPGLPVGALRRVTISNVTVHNADPRYAAVITGIPGHHVEDVSIRDVRVNFRGGLSMTEATEQPPELINKTFAIPGRREPFAVPERADVAPEPAIFGILPAYGCYIRHAKRIEMDNVRVNFLTPDLRPAFVLDDVDGAAFHRCRAAKAPDVPTFVLRDVTEFDALHTRPVADTHLDHVEREEI